MLIDDGALRFDGSMWRAADDVADLTVPPTIQLLLAARLDRLDAEERAVMERGAVEGRVFHAGAVTSLVPDGLRAQVRPRLLTLARKELIRPDRPEFAGEDAFRFRHLLIRDAAYHAMPKEQRADLHERFAGWLERAAGDRSDEYIEILAHHLEQAWRYRRELGLDDVSTAALGDRAAVAMRRAADRVTLRADLPTATHLLERAVEMSAGATQAEIIAELATVLQEQNRHHEAIAAASRIAEADDPAIRIRAEMVLVTCSMWVDPAVLYDDVRHRYDRLREAARVLGSQQLVDRCDLAIGLLRFLNGDVAEYRRIAEELLPRAHTMGITERRTIGFGFGASLQWGPEPASEAASTQDRIEEIYEGSMLGRARAQLPRLVLRSMADDQAGFDEASATLTALQAEVGDPALPLLHAQTQLEAMFRLGRIEDAIAWGLEAKREYDRVGETGANSTLTALTAYYAAVAGSLELADRLIDDARSLASDDDFAAHVPIAWTAALLASARGEHARALDETGRALEMIRPTQYFTFEAETQLVRGTVLRAATRAAEAEAAFDAAHEMFARKEDLASAHRVAEARAGRRPPPSTESLDT